MIRIKHYFLFLISMIIYSVSFSQDDVIILDQIETGATHTHVAQERIEFRPGYEYSAQQDAHVQAYIDEWLVGSTTYSDMFTDQTIGRIIDTSLPVGYSAGFESVTPSGGGAYSVPLFVSPGINDAQPEIGLVYNSQSGNGLLGGGWNISGLSSISRTSKSIYYDGEVSPISLTQGDEQFVLDGQRLVRASSFGPGKYLTEVESYSLISTYGSDTWNPSKFKVETKSGLIMWYGEAEDSNASDGSSYNGTFSVGSNNAVLTWRLVKVIDIDGNYIEYKYDNSGNEPRLKQIIYTGNDIANITPQNTINFYYNNKSSDEIRTNYINGSVSNVQKHLLRKISVKSGEETMREYVLDYGKDHFTYLKELTEYGMNSKQLNSTRFQYESQTAQVENTIHNLYSGTTKSDMFPGDYNGDGKSDLLAVNYTLPDEEYFPNFKEYTTYNLFINENNSLVSKSSGLMPQGATIIKRKKIRESNSLYNSIGDYNGNGLDELLVHQINYIEEDHTPNTLVQSLVFEYDESNNSFNSTIFDDYHGGTYNGIYSLIFEDTFQYGDFNGDGKQDCFSLLKAGSTASILIKYGGSSTNSKLVTNLQFPSLAYVEDLIVVDHNGDGKSDLLCIYGNGLDAKIYSFSSPQTSSSTITVSEIYSGGFPAEWHKCYPADFNGDGKTDLLTYNETAGWITLYSDGAGYGAGTVQMNFPYQIENLFEASEYHKLSFGDFNGDGMADIAYLNNAAIGGTTVNSSRAHIYLSNGIGFSEYTHVFDHPNSKEVLKIVDFEGDGKFELLNDRDAGSCNVMSFEDIGKPRCLTKVLNGFNHDVQFSYKHLSSGSNYIKGSGASHPTFDYQGALKVVSEIQSPSGVNNAIISRRYYYEGAKIHREGKGFLGFEKTKVVNDNIGNYTVSVQSFDNNHFAGVPIKTENYFPTDILQSQTLFTNYELSTLSNNRYVSRIIESQTENFLTGEKRSTNLGYDSHGNVTLSTTSLGDGLETIIVSTPTYMTIGSWRASRPFETTTTTQIGNETPYIRKVRYSYYPNGKVQEVSRDLGTSFSTATNYEYNSIGSITSSTISSPGLPDQVVTHGYGGDGWRVSTTNTNGDVSEYNYDTRFGAMLWGKDITGLRTSYEYDDFGTLIKSIDPLGIETEHTRYWDIRNSNNTPTYAGNTVFYSVTNTEGLPEIRTWVDILGRVRLEETEGFNGQTISTVTSYDERGNTQTQTSPFYLGEEGQAVITNYDYDDETNRIESSWTTDVSSSYSYNLENGLYTTTITKGDSFSSTSVDAAGRAAKTEDLGGEIKTFYYSNGKPKEVHVGGVVTSKFEYDLLGNQTKLDGVNAGVNNYVYNAYDQLVIQTMSNGHTTSIFYDNLGRIDYEETTEGTIDYEYVTAGNGKNQLKKITGPNSSITKEFTYDLYGRVKSEIENLTEDGLIFPTHYTYDALGRLETTKYPSNIVTVNKYNNQGMLSGVDIQGAADPIYTINEVNALGQIEEYTLRNGLVTEKEYNKYGMNTGIVTPGIQDLGYVYDLTTGNMDYRQDNLNGLLEDFDYDDLDRLLESKIRLINNEFGTDLSSQTQTYFDNGNIKTKSDIGTYKYNSSKINAISKLEDVASDFDYDIRNITYSSFDKISTITEENDYLEVTYSPYQTRKKVEFLDNNQPQWTRYYGKQFERFEDQVNNTVTEITYLPGGAVAVSVNGSNPDYFYLHSDHQGSIVAVSDINGNLSGKQSYNPWGRTRNPETWDQTENTTNPFPSWLARGYTGHEHYNAFDLINMNGRTYDPRLARMIQVDNFVQSPNLTQSHNRYSYVWNNPLKYNDPNGEWVHILAGALIGGAINWYTHGATFDMDGLAAFGIGAGAGALGALTGGAAFAAYGGGAAGAGGFAAGFAGGAAGSAASLPVLSMGNTIAFNDPMMTPDQYVIGVITGGVAGGTINGTIARVNGRSFWKGDPLAKNGGGNNSVVHQPDDKYGPFPNNREGFVGPRMTDVEADIYVPSDQPEEGLSQGFISEQQSRIASTDYSGQTYKSLTKSNYRHNLKVSTGSNGVGMDAHHIFPQAQRFQAHWNRVGINIHNPNNMSWWSSSAHRSAAYSYNRAWDTFFRQFPDATRQEIVSFGNTLMVGHGF